MELDNKIIERHSRSYNEYQTIMHIYVVARRLEANCGKEYLSKTLNRLSNKLAEESIIHD